MGICNHCQAKKKTLIMCRLSGSKTVPHIAATLCHVSMSPGLQECVSCQVRVNREAWFQKQGEFWAGFQHSLQAWGLCGIMQ